MDSLRDDPPAKPSVGPRPDGGAPRETRGAALEPSGAALPPDDYVLVGGGLQNGLLALALLAQRPETRLCLIERERTLGGNHTWCFHESDVPEAARSLLDRLVVRRWPAHDVAFPSYRRRVEGGYAAITSERLHEEVTRVIAAAPHARRLVATVTEARSTSVTLAEGGGPNGELVVDARGPEPARSRASGYQKFLGLELALAGGELPEAPLLMDATVPQLDGFRFMYLLPWARDRVLLEDTYYSDRADLDAAALRARVLEYAAAAGLRVKSVLREEQGVLPIPLELDPPAAQGDAREGPLRAGYAGGFFHPTTGYSLPIAVRLALHLASRPAGAALGAEYERWLDEHRRQQRFCLALNRMLFRAFAPAQRYHVLERFYRLPDSTIRRFYALQTSAADRARILCGRPPKGFSLRRLLAGGHPA